jgi:toxin CcdB
VPQFAVYRNRNARSKATFPLLLDVQSDLLDDLNTRVVIPLTRARDLSRKPMLHLTPVLNFGGASYVVMTPQLAAIARADLGEPIGSLATERHEILAAMDFLLTGF